uniref:Cadherin domain-containing protein n=1 Tax=Scophthalmus maximus TaxID=52904 RepID=A0A8D3EG62_SCOMX
MNQRVDCHLEGAGPFRLGPYQQFKNEYLLETTEPLDYEKIQEYELIVVAKNTPGVVIKTLLKVQVLDENDNAPVFQQSLVEISVEENNPPNTFLTQLQASDQDSEGRGEVIYLLGGDSPGIFAVDRVTGVLTTSLDREQQGTYQLWIEAVDGGEPALSCVTMVTVLLLDVNDNPPIVLFPQSNQSYMLVLPNTLPGTSITEVYAVDKDTGMNAVIAYSIIKRKGGEPGSFAIDPETGNITLKRELSNRGLYSLLVKVSDHGQPEPLYSTVMVNFFVNETVSNESYIQSLLTREADIEIEERPWYIGQMTEGPERYELFPCQPVLIVLSVACLGLFFSVVTLTSYICCKRFKKHRKKQSEVEMPLKMKNDSMQVMNRKLRQISNI